MSNGAIILGIAVLAIGGYAYYVKYRNHKFLLEFTNSNSEIVDGELKMEDIAAYFKLQNLNPSQHTPFIAKPEGLNGVIKYIKKPGYQALIVGVYSESNSEIKPIRLFYAKTFDGRLNEAFGTESFVVLS